MVMLGVTAILVGTFFLGSLFLQRVLAETPIQTGLVFVPLVLVTAVATHAGRELLGRVGARATVVAGLALIAAGDVLLSGANAHASYLTDLLPGFSLIGGWAASLGARSSRRRGDCGDARARLARRDPDRTLGERPPARCALAPSFPLVTAPSASREAHLTTIFVRARCRCRRFGRARQARRDPGLTG